MSELVIKWHRVSALLIRHLYLYKRSFPRIMDIFYWPILELLLWGFLSIYLMQSDLGGINAISLLLGGIIFWDLLSQSQKAISIAFLEDVWERNLLNIFVTPVTVTEFLLSTVLLGLVRVIIVVFLMGALAALFYAFNIFSLGFYLIPFLANLIIFGWTLGLFTTGILLRFGTAAQILTWGIMILIQPFTAVFYPVSVLPSFIQPIAYLFPSTYVFEGMREVMATGSLSLFHLLMAIGTNIIYLLLMMFFFYKMFERVKDRGMLMKLT